MNTSKGLIPPRCSRETAAAIAASSDDEIRGPCPYPSGSGGKLEWLRHRQQRFGEHLLPHKQLAKRRQGRDNITAGEMDRLFWGHGLDNPRTICRPPGARGLSETIRPIIAKLLTPE